MSDVKNEHTAEPWREGKAYGAIVADDRAATIDNNDDAIKHYGGALVAESVTPSNRRRIIACVNACAGIRTEALEELGPIAMAIDSGDQMARHQRDELLTLLEELIDIEGPQPGTTSWAQRVQATISRIKSGAANATTGGATCHS